MVSPNFKLGQSKVAGPGSVSAFKQLNKNTDNSPGDDLNPGYVVSSFNLQNQGLANGEDLCPIDQYRNGL